MSFNDGLPFVLLGLAAILEVLWLGLRNRQIDIASIAVPVVLGFVVLVLVHAELRWLVAGGVIVMLVSLTSRHSEKGR